MTNLGPNEMEPSRRAAYDAVNELLRDDPAARPWRAVAVALAAALPVARQAGREDWARGIVGYLYRGPDGKAKLFHPSDVAIVRVEEPNTERGSE